MVSGPKSQVSVPNGYFQPIIISSFYVVLQSGGQIRRYNVDRALSAVVVVWWDDTMNHLHCRSACSCNPIAIRWVMGQSVQGSHTHTVNFLSVPAVHDSHRPKGATEPVTVVVRVQSSGSQPLWSVTVRS